MPRWVCYCLLILAAPAVAQDCTQTVPVRIVDRYTGAPIEDLTREMVTARMGKTPLPISAPTRIRASRIIVLIDESGSMAGIASPNSPFSHAQRDAVLDVEQTLGELMGKMPPGVSIEYGLFNNKWVFSDTFVSDPVELRKNIDEVTARFGKAPSGHTAIYDSLHEALKRFGAPQIGDSILLLTDGGDNSSKLTAKKLEQAFRDANARLFTVMVNELPLTSPQLETASPSLQDLVKKTGGSFLAVNLDSPWWAEKENSLRNAQMVRRFWNERVLSTDVIRVQVPGTLTKEAKWTLSLNREADARLKHAVAIYPTRLGPCAVATARAH
jgi:hypothetical protein